ncbi:unnamed protein product [Larinioides sclopetarius]|uniref:Piezo TM1-24 domain-containing protein n=1 Tax=Larinioides sclopetarius TaxID=280406 RepID=A0AAV2AQ35_9ARAC
MPLSERFLRQGKNEDFASHVLSHVFRLPRFRNNLTKGRKGQEASLVLGHLPQMQMTLRDFVEEEEKPSRMDVKRITIFCLFRIFLPFALLSAVAFRFNFMSFVYLLCLLVNPLLSGPSPRYLKLVIGLSISFCLCHVIFQSVMLSLGNYGSLIDYCTWRGRLYALFGFHRYDSISVQDALRLAGLDFWVMFAAVGVFVAIEKLQAVQQTPPAENPDLADGDVVRRPVRRRKKRRSEVLYWTGETFVLFFLAGSGVLYPSLSSAVYFLVFLTVCTWLSCNRKIGRKYLQTKIPLLVYCAVHFVSIYLYQVDFVQDYIPPESLPARLLGLPDLVLHNCSSPDPRTLIFQGHSWAIYASPFFVLGLYCLLALIIRKQLIAPSVDECKYDPPMSRADSKQSSQFSQSSVRRRKSSRRATRNRDSPLAEPGTEASVTDCLNAPLIEPLVLILCPPLYGKRQFMKALDKDPLLCTEGNFRSFTHKSDSS